MQQDALQSNQISLSPSNIAFRSCVYPKCLLPQKHTGGKQQTLPFGFFKLWKLRVHMLHVDKLWPGKLIMLESCRHLEVQNRKEWKANKGVLNKSNDGFRTKHTTPTQWHWRHIMWWWGMQRLCVGVPECNATWHFTVKKNKPALFWEWWDILTGKITSNNIFDVCLITIKVVLGFVSLVSLDLNKINYVLHRKNKPNGASAKDSIITLFVNKPIFYLCIFH